MAIADHQKFIWTKPNLQLEDSLPKNAPRRFEPKRTIPHCQKVDEIRLMSATLFDLVRIFHPGGIRSLTAMRKMLIHVRARAQTAPNFFGNWIEVEKGP